MTRQIILAILTFIVISPLLPAAENTPAGSEKQTHYYKLLFDGHKVGHMVKTRHISDGKITNTTETNYIMTRLGTDTKVIEKEKIVETLTGKPIAFEYEQSSGGDVRRNIGTVDNGVMNIKTISTSRTTTRRIPLPEDTVMDEGLFLHIKNNGLTRGDTFTVHMFEPLFQDAVPMKVRVGEEQEIEAEGKNLRATRIDTLMKCSTAAMPYTAYYANEDFKLIRDVSPQMGMKMETAICTRGEALSENEKYDIIERVLIPSPTWLKDLSRKTTAKYVIKPLTDRKLHFHAGPRQSVMRKADGTTIIEVSKAEMTGGTFPYDGDDSDLLDALKASTYIQKDDEKIKELANKAVTDCETAAQAVKEIERFVYSYVSENDLSIGYASAAEVARTGLGDCTEHALLATGMCRAAGIPARVVMGIVYMQKAFWLHAWCEAYVNGQWVGLDPTHPTGWNIGHVAFGKGDGDPADYMGMYRSIGYFKIQSIETE
ncbi:putative protein involved in cytokinesis, contains TGc (transglutaminase/protease-like) domain [Anaerohalosphaera lusitana]|uniref:Transglutaminase-like domain-containing protein n=1 Tax=Anaerohalosphaera lusitana TaxID=1936003 RepID=A0A1U9NIY5_9BACT|nr:transglutaminase-like domain-containing protein [Anaerohalosphaera lusitana]AQT67684.1 putative protein involved in cytokinesis, contains TGc (transglutaminase/protease-like) domain [Anaerohalosphaera lusitana]